jgi:hypothetical protein
MSDTNGVTGDESKLLGVSVRGWIAILISYSACWISAMGMPLSETMTAAWFTAMGFYFGQRGRT